MESNDLYPPSPARTGRRTEATLAYRLRVAFVLLSLSIFLGIYLGLIVATAYALHWLIVAPEHLGFAGFMLGIGGCMLLLFLLKGIFRREKPGVDGRFQITEQEQPKLFAFLRRLCADAGSAFPAAVYVSPEVNAAVFYRRSFLSLFFPQRKSLLIGLGLVSALDVSELKAVLAHEFGHFAQSSMKLGQYVYVANQVIYDMVFTRDAWDEWLAKWRAIDLRLSFPAWILTAVVWVIRKALELLFKLVNFANLSLSRQMEFDADLHAVRLTGSDALISALWKAERAGLAMEGAWSTLSTVIGYDKFTSDVFHHQRAHLKRLDDMLAQETEPTPFVLSLRAPYRYGAALHFQAGDDHAPSMWSTHPSNRDREENAKRDYIAVEPVKTSAWQLFEHRKRLKRRLTLTGYEMRLGRRIGADACLPAPEVEALIREDQEEQQQAAHYHGLYESRFVDPGDVKQLAAEVDAMPPERHEELREAALRWAGAPLAEIMEAFKREEADEQVLEAAANAKGKGAATFVLRGATHQGSEAPRMLEKVQKRLAPLREQIAGADAIIFRHFYARTADDEEAREELLARYEFLRAMEDHIKTMLGAESIFGQVIGMIQQGNQLAEGDFERVKSGFAEVHARLDRVLEKARKQRVPKLAHLEENAKVRDYILTESIVEAPYGDRIEGTFIGELGRQVGITLSRLRRLHFKNLGALLRLQEKLDPEMYGGAKSEEPEATGAVDAAETDADEG